MVLKTFVRGCESEEGQEAVSERMRTNENRAASLSLSFSAFVYRSPAVHNALCKHENIFFVRGNVVESRVYANRSSHFKCGTKKRQI